jgi:hypothetical protein
MDLIKGEGIVFQNKDGIYIHVDGFPGRGGYLAGIFKRGTIAGEDVFLPDFQLRSGIGKLPVPVSEEELNNPSLFTRIGVPGTEGVPGIYPVHLY